MPASNQQSVDVIAAAFQFCDISSQHAPRCTARCHMLVARTSEGGTAAFSTGDQPMQAYSFEIGSEAGPSPDEAPRAQFFGTERSMMVPNSATSGTAHIMQNGRRHAASSEATHTDPQILFSAVTA